MTVSRTGFCRRNDSQAVLTRTGFLGIITRLQPQPRDGRPQKWVEPGGLVPARKSIFRIRVNGLSMETRRVFTCALGSGQDRTDEDSAYCPARLARPPPARNFAIWAQVASRERKEPQSVGSTLRPELNSIDHAPCEGVFHMAQNHARTESGHSQPNSPILNIAHLPMSGRYPISVLAAKFLETDPETVRRWVKKYNCPFKKPGEEMWVDVADLWNSWPYQNPADTPPRRGGFRKKAE